MQNLILEPNLSSTDDFYQMLIDMHQGLDDAESQLVNAKLILLLSNHIGDIGILRQAMDIARTAK
ncbi:DUF2783 domain-containing protein [Noviherbaspirillum sp.]|uniref:DUF2783 domain-containing protein n=1 Tax=Noviherbaspirillum sp. TaxID=1926288 RepID=UPI002FE1BA02